MRCLALLVALTLATIAACRGHEPHAPSGAAAGDPSAAAPVPAPAGAAGAASTPTTMTNDPAPTSVPATTPDPAAKRAGIAAKTEVATFANGCFWCTEAVLEQVDGVLDVTAGYMGGTVENPTYQQVCGGETGHAECVQVTYDPARIDYASLLDWFFRSHDPTTRDRQGADVGTQYRSAIFVHDDAQEAAAKAAIRTFQPSFAQPIVTEVTRVSRFWPAEKYHQDYFRLNPNDRYCRVVIAPKLKKLGLKDAR